MAATSRGGFRAYHASKSQPFIVIGLLVVITIIGMKYWNAASQNSVLMTELRKIQLTLKTCSEHFAAVDTEKNKHAKMSGEKDAALEDTRQQLIDLQTDSKKLKEQSVTCRKDLSLCMRNATERTQLCQEQLNQRESECDSRIEHCKDEGKQSCVKDVQEKQQELDEIRRQVTLLKEDAQKRQSEIDQKQQTIAQLHQHNTYLKDEIQKCKDRSRDSDKQHNDTKINQLSNEQKIIQKGDNEVKPVETNNVQAQQPAANDRPRPDSDENTRQNALVKRDVDGNSFQKVEPEQSPSNPKNRQKNEPQQLETNREQPNQVVFVQKRNRARTLLPEHGGQQNEKFEANLRKDVVVDTGPHGLPVGPSNDLQGNIPQAPAPDTDQRDSRLQPGMRRGKMPAHDRVAIGRLDIHPPADSPAGSVANAAANGREAAPAIAPAPGARQVEMVGNPDTGTGNTNVESGLPVGTGTKEISGRIEGEIKNENKMAKKQLGYGNQVGKINEQTGIGTHGDTGDQDGNKQSETVNQGGPVVQEIKTENAAATGNLQQDERGEDHANQKNDEGNGNEQGDQKDDVHGGVGGEQDDPDDDQQDPQDNKEDKDPRDNKEDKDQPAENGGQLEDTVLEQKAPHGQNIAPEQQETGQHIQEEGAGSQVGAGGPDRPDIQQVPKGRMGQEGAGQGKSPLKVGSPGQDNIVDSTGSQKQRVWEPKSKAGLSDNAPGEVGKQQVKPPKGLNTNNKQKSENNAAEDDEGEYAEEE